jgi:hypothetical protein
MKHMCVRLVTVALCALLAATSAWAQGSTANITGVVMDSGGGVIPGADINVKNNGTGETYNAVSNEQGLFSFPSMTTGTYTVTVSLQGFKTAVLNNVVVNAGVPASLRATLEIGGLTEQVTVQARSELVQTTTATVATTLDTRQVQSLPLSSRNAADFIVFLPGVTTPGGSRDSIVNGLPQSTINMTLDGVNIQDNTLKSTDGFFAIVGPRLDAIEEITVTTAATGAEGTGAGATQIRYVTRSGTNDFRGGVFHTYRSDELNTNTWFNKRDNLPKSDLLQNQPGFNMGGPIMRNKAFFFVNYEELRQPSATRRNRTILHPEAQAGTFRYLGAGNAVVTRNLFELAAANGINTTPDPLMIKLLADIRASTATTGNVRDLADPLFQEYSFQVPTTTHNRYPTVRVDYQINDKHRATYSMNWQYFCCGPDTTNNRDNQFPGFPVWGNQDSVRKATSGWLRSILSPTMVNEFRIGHGGAPVIFAQLDFKPEMWSGSLANQGGMHLNMNNTLGITNAGAAGNTSGRDAYHTSIENTVNWQKGSHSLNFGGSFTQYDLWMENQQIVPTALFNVVAGDPAETMFTTANFPGASTANLDRAKALYAVLTGRVSELQYTARLNANGEYEVLGQGAQLAQQRQFAFWAQDAWRMGSNFTLNYGARYDLTMPFVSLNNSYSIGDIDDVYGVSGVGNLFKPGTLTGSIPQFRQLSAREKAYPTDWNNIAPSIGMAWTPSANSGFLRKVTGNTGDLSVRAGYSRSFTRLGLSDFQGQIANNPGVSLTANRTLSGVGVNSLGQLPLLFRDTARLGPGAYPATPSFPYTEQVTGDITIFDPELYVPVTDTWQAGATRALGRSMSIEARYLGARSDGNWRTNNYNELNIIENGFLDEYKLAMGNLQANIAAGRGTTFAYTGIPGTSPLPTFLAYFAGLGRDRANDPAAYNGVTQFSNSTYYNNMARFNPNPYGVATSLNGDATLRARALNGGLAANFFVVNPHLLGGANIVQNEDRTMYNSLALEFKRRSGRGLTYTGSYILGHATASQFLSLRVDSPMLSNGGEEGNINHAFKFNAVYALPFGREQRWLTNLNPVVDRIIGGWQLAGNARVQSGRLLDLGNVRLVGMDKDDLQKMFKLRIDSQNRVYMLPQEIIDESFKAFSVSATSASGYGSGGAPTGRYIAPADSFDCIERIRGLGECGLQSVVLSGPLFKQFDLSLVKRVDIVGRLNAEIRLDALNVFDHVNFSPVSGITSTNNRAAGATLNSYETTQLTGTNTSRVLQLVSRIRW